MPIRPDGSPADRPLPPSVPPHPFDLHDRGLPVRPHPPVLIPSVVADPSAPPRIEPPRVAGRVRSPGMRQPETTMARIVIEQPRSKG